MSDFPPHGCEWAKPRSGEFKPDYCYLGDAVREQLAQRAKDAETIDKLIEALRLRIAAAECSSEQRESCELGDICHCRVTARLAL